MKKIVALLCMAVLLGMGVLAMAEGVSERIAFEDSGFSLVLPEGWTSRDLAESINEGGEKIMMGEQEMDLLGLIMIGDPAGVSLFSFVVLAVPAGYDPSTDVKAYEEAYTDGEWIELDGRQFFTFIDENRMKYVLGYTEERIYSIYGEVLNQGFEDQFDEVIQSFLFV